MDEITYSFGYWIQRRRKALDLTRAALAARVNCSSDTIKKIERDERRPSPQVADLLAEALALSPGERTTFLQVARRQRPVDSLALAREPLQPLPLSLTNNLPAQLTPFIGRERELSEIAARLGDPDCRLLNLVGPGGTGKTRLALKAAENRLAEYRHGACFVPLAGLEDPQDLAAAVLDSLRLPRSGSAEPQDQLLAYLRKKQLLLILDNFEHLLPDTGLLTAILRNAPEVVLLVTARQRLSLQSEWIYLVDGLPAPEPEGGSPVESYSSVELFVQAAGRISPGFILDETNRPWVARICRQVAGMPLALELAAAWSPALDPRGIAEGIAQGLDILEAELGDLPERQRSMRAVFAASWKLLEPEEQQAVQELAVFRGGFNLAAAEAAFGVSPKQILSLMSKCWVQAGTVGRFQLHELVRQYAREKLQPDPDFMHSVEERHSTYFCGVLSKHEENWFTAREGEALREIDVEYPNIDAAWNWALKQQRLDLVVSASESLARYYGQYLRFKEEFAAMESALQCMDDIQNKQGKESNTVLLARVRAMIALVGRLATRGEIRKEFAKVRILLDQLEKDECETRPERARILSWEGHLMMNEDPQKTFDLYHQAGALYREMGNDILVAEVFYSIGEKYELLGELHQAFHYINQCLQISNKTGYPRLLADCNMLLGILNRQIGNVEEAERFGRSSLEEYRKQGLRYDDGFALLHLCYTLMIAGKFPEALLHAKNSLKVFDWLGTGPNHEAASQIMIALIMLHQGQYEQVEQLIKYSFDNMNNIQDSRVKGLIFTTSGAFLLLKQQEEQAVEHFQMSLQIYQKGNFISMAGIPEAYLAYAFLAFNQLSEAEQHLIQCMKDAVQIGSYLFAIQALPALALQEAAWGNSLQAIQLYSLARRYPYVANSKWFQDVAGDQIDSLAAALPAECVSAARVQGRSLDFWETIQGWLAERVPMPLEESPVASLFEENWAGAASPGEEGENIPNSR
jgi:predicted ATPase/DNA-binding XRE family transcriptional regulator